MSLRSRLILLVLLSSVLLPLALPNELLGAALKALGLRPDQSFYWGDAILGLVCIAPLFYAIVEAPSFGFASILGMIFGAVSTLLASYWLMFFQNFSVWTMGGTVLGYVGYNAVLFPFLRGFSNISGRFRPFVLAAAWAVYEYFKSIGFLGYPWGLVADPATGVLPLIQIADVTGIWGLSFLMALGNALVAEYALNGYRLRFLRQAVFSAVLVAAALVYGVVRLATPIPSHGTASMLLVQQNMDPWQEGVAAAESVRINAQLTIDGVSRAKDPPDLAVWSESSVSTPELIVVPGNRFNREKNDLVPMIQRAGVPILFGGVVEVSRAQQEYMNASVLVDGRGAILDTYGKIHPVPFAESIPFFEYPAVRRFFRDVVGLWNEWTMGKRYTIYRVPLAAGGQLAFGTPICFEDAFADVCRGFVLRGAGMLVNITNDSWSKTWSAEIQHFQVARLRAVENRRVLVRSTNGGVSGVVGPWGEIRAEMPLFQSTWGLVRVPVYESGTFTLYTRLGDWFPQVLIVVLFVFLALSVALSAPWADTPPTGRRTDGAP